MLTVGVINKFNIFLICIILKFFICLECPRGCTACAIDQNDGILKCSTCGGSDRSGDNCLCDAEFFDDGTLTCAACNYKCATCRNFADNCLCKKYTIFIFYSKLIFIYLLYI